jgi:Fe2+ or Zn2+ uptake regulation protein
MAVTKFSDLIFTALIQKIQAEKQVAVESKQVELECICQACAAHPS